MNKQSGDSNFISFIKTQRWLLPVLVAIFLLLLGSMIYFSEELELAPIYSKF